MCDRIKCSYHHIRGTIYGVASDKEAQPLARKPMEVIPPPNAHTFSEAVRSGTREELRERLQNNVRHKDHEHESFLELKNEMHQMRNQMQALLGMWAGQDQKRQKTCSCPLIYH